MLPEITRDELTQALDAAVAEALTALGITGPPIDVLQVAEALGLDVAVDRRQAGRARFVRLDGSAGGSRGSILVRPEPRQERLHWAIAHEVGEELSARVFDLLSVDPAEAPPAARETVANQLAGRLLLPGDWFRPDAVACDWDLAALKQRYSTASHELLARRMLDFESPSVIVTIFDQGRVSFRRGNLPGRLPPPTPDELALWQSTNDTALPQTHDADSWTLACWPIHEPEWRREILRSQWNGE